jgi:hypothetical protein
MPLHRDIHWIGRQWAVTGLGMQLIDQKLKGFFDVEASRLWEEALIEAMRAKEWLNVADFERGLEVARKRFPQAGVTPSPPIEAVAPAPPVASRVLPVALPIVQTAPVVVAPPATPTVSSSVVTPPIEPRSEVAKPGEPRLQKFDPVAPLPAPPAVSQPAAIATPEPDAAPPVPTGFHMLFSGHAKFIRPWRVRMKN